MRLAELREQTRRSVQQLQSAPLKSRVRAISAAAATRNARLPSASWRAEKSPAPRGTEAGVEVLRERVYQVFRDMPQLQGLYRQDTTLRTWSRNYLQKMLLAH